MDKLLQELEKAKLLSSCVYCQNFASATKLLPCSHAICEDCYEQVRADNCVCPQCAHKVSENENVEDNYFLNNFLKYEQIISKLSTQQLCTKCHHLPSTIYCQHCDLLLCSVDFQMEHSQNWGINQHEYICSKPTNMNGTYISTDNEKVFVKSSSLQTNEKIASIYHGLSVYDILQNIWQGRHDNIGRSFSDIDTLERDLIEQVTGYYEDIIHKARDTMDIQVNYVKKYYESERGNLRKKLEQTKHFVEQLEQTQSIVRVYTEFSDSYELLDKSAAMVGRLERIFKQFVERKWSYPDIIQIRFDGCNINEVVDTFGKLKRYRNFRAKFYPKISFGAYTNNNRHFNTIQGLAIHRDTTLFISDSGSKCVYAYSTTGKFSFCLGEFGGSEGQFIEPGHITVHEDFVYVSDSGRCDVQIFKCGDGAYVGKLGRKGNKEETLASPNGVAVSKVSKKVYVVDRPKQCIKVYSPNNEFIKAICRGHLLEPCDIAISANGDLYVVDCAYKCVHVFNQEGELIREFGYRGEGKELVNPCYLALDDRDHVVLSDRLGHQICVYTVRGDLVNRFGGFGTSHGKVRFPNGIVVDSEGNMFVCDTSNHRIQKF